ncbi:MAG: putative reverse transcriptase [Streblomastix strix]|uniref:Putative reverse transcriptase n=1 Tax=Streblomastix strix TaxID=222440 RepID=A0A5J4VN59_9EUKA|nr:MAG: putative reverse transcriptase [Streblomastix strix]
MKALKEELDLRIVKEVKDREIMFYNKIFVIPRKDGRLRKIIDCHPINKYLKDDPFQNENFQNVCKLSIKGDWATIIDIHNAYNHVLVSDELQKFLAFGFQGHTYTYVGMSFCLKTAPYIFNQHLQPANTRLRTLGIEIIMYIDDIQKLNQNPESLFQQTVLVKELLEKLDWIISNKSILVPNLQVQFIGWIWNFSDLTIQMPSDRRTKLIIQLIKWNKLSNHREEMQTKDLAKIIGKQIFIRSQFPRALLHIKLLFRLLNRTTNKIGWNGVLHQHQRLKKSWMWHLLNIQKNNPQHFEIILSQATLTTDTSRRRWVATLQFKNSNNLLKTAGKYSRKWILNSINQLELTAVLCGLRRNENQFIEGKIHSLHLRTDNTTTSFKINRANSSLILAHLSDLTLRVAENMNIQIKAIYIPGIENKVADSFSRFPRAGDNSINKNIAAKLFKKIQFNNTIDLFANRNTMLTDRYCIITQDHQAVARDAFSIKWSSEQPLIHPPIPLIGRCFKRIQQENLKALMIVPKWLIQYWWPLITSMTSKAFCIGNSNQILKNGPAANRRGLTLPPRDLLAILIDL